jgi:hypothetical protein
MESNSFEVDQNVTMLASELESKMRCKKEVWNFLCYDLRAYLASY